MSKKLEKKYNYSFEINGEDEKLIFYNFLAMNAFTHKTGYKQGQEILNKYDNLCKNLKTVEDWKKWYRGENTIEQIRAVISRQNTMGRLLAKAKATIEDPEFNNIWSKYNIEEQDLVEGERADSIKNSQQ